MPFIQLENQSKLTTFVTKKEKSSRVTPGVTGAWGHGKALIPVGLPQESRLENWRTRPKDQREGGYRATEGEKGVAGASQFTSPKGPRGLLGEPKDRIHRFSSIPTCPQNCPNKTGGLQK